MFNLDNSPLAAFHMPRPRLNGILSRLTQCRLVYVIAGAGYGKTQAVHHFIEQQPDAVVRWIQLTDSDNIGSRFWENLTRSISPNSPVLAAGLSELGFPETPSRFRQFTEILRTSEYHAHKTYLVLDDFHVIHSKQMMKFAERCTRLQIPGLCLIILARHEPQINTVSLFSRGQAGCITEDDLCFTETELSDFLKLCGVTFSSGDLPLFTDATKGWALAVKMLSLILARAPGNVAFALSTMKQNIFKLLETEAWVDLPTNVRKTMVRLSLISDLPLSPLSEVFDDVSLMKYARQLSSFIWFESFTGDYRVHPLYLEFVQSKHGILSDKEKEDTYLRAAAWCLDNGFFTDAVNHLAKSRQYGRLLEVLLSHPFKLPAETCEFFLGILEDLDPDAAAKDDHDLLLLKNMFVPLLLIGAGRYDEARERAVDVIRKWEPSDMPFARNILYIAYSNLAYIDTYACTVTHEYAFSEYLRKSVEHYESSTIPPIKISGAFAVADVRSFACLVGEGASLSEFDAFLEAARETEKFIPRTFHGMYHGYADLVACELDFFKNKLDLALGHANNAIIKARENKQHSIEALTQYYLLRIAIHDGDYSLTREILRQLREHLYNPDFWNRQLLYDIITGSFFAHIEFPENVPSWLAVDEKEFGTAVHIPVRELIVGVRYYMAVGKFKQALAILSNSYPRYPEERFHFGELVLALLLAVARLKTDDEAGAADEFERAYRMSYDGVFEMPFIELGRLFHLLSGAVQKKEDCGIPVKWLRETERKANIYVKKTAVIINSFRKEHNIGETILLTEREQDVLNDLYHGLSRDEIAINRYLSINTVNKNLQSIFRKLDANNNIDVIRVAIEKRLVE